MRQEIETDTAVLDNPAFAALTGPHAYLAERVGQAYRYPVDVSPFVAVPDNPGPGVWDDLFALFGPDQSLARPSAALDPPPGWIVESTIAGVQLVDDGVADEPFDEAVELTAADVPDMLELVSRTKPGPFLPRTIELGTYLGVRRDGRLIAMAGERLHPPGWTEISAVCTDLEFRGQGLGTRLVLAVAHGIRQRGETPFMHASASNTNAIRLYESIGFRLRTRTVFGAVRTPAVGVPR